MSKYKKMKQLIADMRLPEYRYKQLLDAVFLQGIMRFEDMKLLPKTLREKLVEQFGETVVEIKAIHHEKSMQTDKVLFELSDGNRVETVGLFYKEGWNSFCISSQSGCGFGCKFCATGTLGLRRNLTVDEITDQILYFMQQGCSINSISFMGMGEPFANPQVFEALHDLTAPELFGLSQRRITISTIGIVPGIQKLTREYPQVNLAYSLHAPTDRLRETLMPITKTYPLGQVLDTLDQHIRQTNRKVFLAYIMLKDVNDSDRHAEQLTKLLFKHKKYLPLYHLDLIPYNQTTVTETMVPSSHTRIKAFCRIIELASISERNLAPILTLLVASWRGPTVTIKNKEREQCPLYKNSLLNGSCVLCARAKHDLKSERTRYLTISHSFVPNAKVKCLSVSNNFIYLLSKSQTHRRRADNP